MELNAFKCSLLLLKLNFFFTQTHAHQTHCIEHKTHHYFHSTEVQSIVIKMIYINLWEKIQRIRFYVYCINKHVTDPKDLYSFFSAFFSQRSNFFYGTIYSYFIRNNKSVFCKRTSMQPNEFKLRRKNTEHMDTLFTSVFFSSSSQRKSNITIFNTRRACG